MLKTLNFSSSDPTVTNFSIELMRIGVKVDRAMTSIGKHGSVGNLGNKGMLRPPGEYNLSICHIMSVAIIANQSDDDSSKLKEVHYETRQQCNNG